MSVIVSIRSCASCKHGQPGQGPGLVACHFNPPTACVPGVGPQGPIVLTIWPQTNRDDLCSKWERKFLDPKDETACLSITP